MGFGITQGLQLASGVAGLFGAGGASREQEGYYREAARGLRRKNAALDRMSREADAYDPAKEDQTAVDYASGVAGDTLRRGLRNLNADFVAGGGSPTGDTLFRTKESDLAARATDPLKAYAANAAGTRFQRRMGALAGVAEGGGDVIDSYLRMGDRAGAGADPSGAIGLVAGALDPRPKGTSQRSVNPASAGAANKGAAKAAQRLTQGLTQGVRWL